MDRIVQHSALDHDGASVPRRAPRVLAPAALGSPLKPVWRWNCHDTASYFDVRFRAAWPDAEIPVYTVREASVIKRRLSWLRKQGFGAAELRALVDYVVAYWDSGLALRLPALGDGPPDYRIFTWPGVVHQLVTEAMQVARDGARQHDWMVGAGDREAAIDSYMGRLDERLGHGIGLLLSGSDPTTTSAIAARVADEALRRGRQPRTLSAFDLAEAWRWERGAYEATQDAVPLVVLGLGEEGDWGDLRGMVVRALRFRLERLRATVLTTVLDPVQMHLVYGDRLVVPLIERTISVRVAPSAEARAGDRRPFAARSPE